jgi:hypothetical protein
MGIFAPVSFQSLACTDPQRRLDFLNGTPSERRLRLFAVACFRLEWSQLDDPCRALVDCLEARADGLATPAEVEAALELACGAPSGGVPFILCLYLLDAATGPALDMATTLCHSIYSDHRILHNIFGNRFGSVTLDRSWLTSTVTALAQASTMKEPSTACPFWQMLLRMLAAPTKTS